ncbi:type I 3-dehydroquinate dehydratase [Staphylococcus sp. SQ8-PEA]|uniref:3-dehydroquinate dehydratase n=1 Tax=Staphylococcus marylandisciuri TaxID=2981529 RepID=A0ABT2QSW7_9STAP|nr:type I 3-dehydroquinate dehydratase [Staphylococcus marylandisciuri]MCU5747081.1 type I 3-dehydroquinate dehydratase [Staphylococcus marylandisciuri]
MSQPKIAVTLSPAEQLESDCIELLEKYNNAYDIIELRIDQLLDVEIAEVLKIVKVIKQVCVNKEILVTYRTKGQGGKGAEEGKRYFHYIKNLIAQVDIDLIDIEFDEREFSREIQNCISEAQQRRIQVVLSHHNFKETPDIETLKFLYYKMNRYSPDYLKVAVMPQSSKDVLTLLGALQATSQSVAASVIGIAMGEVGKVSRVATGVFGGSVTYGCLTEPQAPGQLQVADLKSHLSLYD